jgi:hypothetical protein
MMFAVEATSFSDQGRLSRHLDGLDLRKYLGDQRRVTPDALDALDHGVLDLGCRQ